LWGPKEGNQSFYYRSGAPLYQGLDHALEGGKGIGPSLILGALGDLSSNHRLNPDRNPIKDTANQLL
jgi:hypothetical protein